LGEGVAHARARGEGENQAINATHESSEQQEGLGHLVTAADMRPIAHRLKLRIACRHSQNAINAWSKCTNADAPKR
jgi:hypothetical protein